jgi:hypothetical protein
LSTAGATVNDCYEKYDYTVDITYNGAGGTVVVDNREIDTDNTTPTAFEIEDSDDYTYLDNEQLLFALRGVNPSINTSPNFQIYAALQNQTQIVNATFEKVETSKFTFALNGEAARERDISYYPVSLSLQQANNGQPQTVWYAKTTDAANNTYRNVMLYMETPVFANNGSLCYKLKKADFMNI